MENEVRPCQEKWYWKMIGEESHTSHSNYNLKSAAKPLGFLSCFLSCNIILQAFATKDFTNVNSQLITVFLKPYVI